MADDGYDLGQQGAGTTTPTLGDLLDASEAPGALSQAGTSDMVTDLGVDPAAEIPATLGDLLDASHPLSLHDELAAAQVSAGTVPTATTAGYGDEPYRRHWPRLRPVPRRLRTSGTTVYGQPSPVDVDDSPLGGLGCPEVSGSVGSSSAEARSGSGRPVRTWRAVRSRSASVSAWASRRRRSLISYRCWAIVASLAASSARWARSVVLRCSASSIS